MYTGQCDVEEHSVVQELEVNGLLYKIFNDLVKEIHRSGSIVLGEKVTPKVSQSSIVLEGTELKKNRFSECCAYL